MKILILSPYPEKVEHIFLKEGDEVLETDEPLMELPEVDWVVSFGYRHLIKEPVLSHFAGRIINLHIAYLPWNRGADPNFWSWFDHSPKGVSIHYIDAGIDTGDILVQATTSFAESETLATSYEKLQAHVINLFSSTWPLIRSGKIKPFAQQGAGSFHKSQDKAPYWKLLPLGYDTPVTFIENLSP